MDPITRSILELTPRFAARNAEYSRRWAYYKGNVYMSDGVKDHLKKSKRLTSMQEVYNCVTQAVDVATRFVMKRNLRVLCPDDRSEWEDMLDEIWEASSFQKNKYKLVRTGANLGDCYLIVKALDEFPHAKIEVANSEDIEIFTNPHDQSITERAVQRYNFYDPVQKKVCSWDRVWYPTHIETYIDGKYMDEFSSEHPFGEVPVVHIKHLDIGEALGLHTWHNIQAQVDAVNELASYMWLILQRYGEPTMIASGPTKPDKIVRKDGNIIYVGMDGDLKLLEYVGNVLPNIESFSSTVVGYIQEAVPELTLGRIRDLGTLSGFAVSMHLADLIAKIEELRGNYADGIEWANALALKARLKSNLSVNEFQNDVVFESILPEDQMEKWNINQKRIDLGIESRSSIMREEGMTEEAIDARFQEIKDELEDMLDVTYPGRAYTEVMADGTAAGEGEFEFGGLEDV